MNAPMRIEHSTRERVIGISLWMMLTIGMAATWTSSPAPASPPDQEYRIETIAGNGRPEDIPEGGGQTREVPVDLPFGVENGPSGTLFVTSVGRHRVLRLDRGTGRLLSVVGNGRRGYSGDGGPAREAMLNQPYEVRFDSQGNMLILEMQNHVLRRVDSRSDIISTLSGDGVAGYGGDGGPALKARFRDPHSLILDEHDNIYISDLSNHRVRRIDAKSGRIETVAGNGQRELPQDGGKAREQPFLTPQGLAVRGDNLWIASYSGHTVWRLELRTGLTHRVAGTGRKGHSGDGGDPLKATFDGPRGIMLTTSGVLYVADGENNIIRAIDTVHGSIRTIAGVGPGRHLYAGDGILATNAPLWQPHGICVGENGALVVSDTINHRVRLLLPIPRAR
jgi:DNA-binding beta-propeller fold protein YncE